MADDKGTELGGDWFLVREADCTDDSGELTDLEHLFDASDESFVELDIEDQVDEGNSAALHNVLMQKDADKVLQDLKRKYCSPSPKSVQELSPRLELVSLSTQRSSKRRLFKDHEHETSSSSGNSSAEVESSGGGDKTDLATALLSANNRKAAALYNFKQTFGVKFSDLTRVFMNDKTCTPNWVAAVLGPPPEMVESAKISLQGQCVFFQIVEQYSDKGFVALCLFEFKTSKCRITVSNLLCNIFQVDPCQLLLEPPKLRSTVAALFFFKKSIAGGSYMYGNLPDWVSKLTIVSHQAAASDSFELSEMVQWAYDNDLTEDSEVAYYYATQAENDANAAAFLKSNNQPKIVRDCVSMVKLYKLQELKNMSLTEYVVHRCSRVSEKSDWKVFMRLLKYQGVNGVLFLAALKDLLSEKPKKQCIVIYGPPNTGKSYMLYSLINFLKGKVITFFNSRSQFWLQPLVHAKVGLLDDATEACWNYFDIYMRTALDGNHISIDRKFKSAIQMRLPPLFISTNVRIPEIAKYDYLKSRMVCFEFPKECLFDDNGNPYFNLTDSTWKGVFEHLASQLGLDFSEKEEDGVSRSFRCVPRKTADTD